MLDRGDRVSLESQRIAQIVVSGREIGTQADRGSEVVDGLFHGTQVDQRRTEIAVVLGMIRLKRQRRPVSRHRASDLSQCPVCLGEGGVEGRVVGPDGDRPAHERHRSARVPSLEREEAQKVQRVGIVGFLSESRLITARGLVEPALPVMLNRRAQIESHGCNPSREVMRLSGPANPKLPDHRAR